MLVDPCFPPWLRFFSLFLLCTSSPRYIGTSRLHTDFEIRILQYYVSNRVHHLRIHMRISTHWAQRMSQQRYPFDGPVRRTLVMLQTDIKLVQSTVSTTHRPCAKTFSILVPMFKSNVTFVTPSNIPSFSRVSSTFSGGPRHFGTCHFRRVLYIGSCSYGAVSLPKSWTSSQFSPPVGVRGFHAQE